MALPIAAELGVADQQMYGASAHSDYGMITLLAAEDVGGLQACFHRVALVMKDT